MRQYTIIRMDMPDKSGAPGFLEQGIEGLHFPPIGGTIQVGGVTFPITEVRWDVSQDQVYVIITKREGELATDAFIREILETEGFEFTTETD